MGSSPVSAGEEVLTTRQLMDLFNKRMLFGMVASLATSGILGVAVLTMMPLKEMKPFVVHVHDDGAVTIPPQTEAEAFKPEFVTTAYFIRRWVEDAFTINQYTTVSLLDPRARAMLRGDNAIRAYDDLMESEKKFKLIAGDVTYSREISDVRITPIAGTTNGVVAEFRLKVKSAGDVKEERRLMTIYFEIFPLDPQECQVTRDALKCKDVEMNPIGLFITDFKLGSENANQ